MQIQGITITLADLEKAVQHEGGFDHCCAKQTWNLVVSSSFAGPAPARRSSVFVFASLLIDSLEWSA